MLSPDRKQIIKSVLVVLHPVRSVPTPLLPFTPVIHLMILPQFQATRHDQVRSGSVLPAPLSAACMAPHMVTCCRRTVLHSASTSALSVLQLVSKINLGPFFRRYGLPRGYPVRIDLHSACACLPPLVNNPTGMGADWRVLVFDLSRHLFVKLLLLSLLPGLSSRLVLLMLVVVASAVTRTLLRQIVGTRMLPVRQRYIPGIVRL